MKRSKLTSYGPLFLWFAYLFLAMAGCSSGSNSGGPGTLGLSLSSSMALAPQDGTPAKITATASGNSGAVTFSVSGLPSGTVSNVAQQSGTISGAMTLTSSATTPAGTYSLKVTATDSSGSSASQSLTLVVAVAGMVSAAVDQTQGVNGKLQQFMSTSFQPAEWDYQFFLNHPDVTPLTSLGPQHIRIQGLSKAIPIKANSNPQQPTDWDFTMLDDVVQPILGAADHSPEFQIAVTPSFISLPSPLVSNDPNLQLFAAYCANLVSYYNTGGFTWGGRQFKSASPNKITWWGIFNEYNINGLTPADYVVLYNAVVPAMLKVDSTIKFSALELADFDCCTGDPRVNLPTFMQPVNAGGVSAQVNIVSTHFYSSCNQQDSDTKIFGTIPGFVNDVKYFYQELQLRPDLATVPVWVTENNVNADFDKGGGISNCNSPQKFVMDLRGTSAFFAAWRPYVFSQLGKAGNQALYHWDYDADAQFGEVDFNTSSKQLSYWVDYWLAQMYPQTPAPPDILRLTITETTTLETLATKNSDGSILLMVADRAVLSPSDNNGPGDARTVILDISALGNFTSASQLDIGAKTDVTNGPQPSPITLASKLTVTLPGYGVSFLLLKP
ncbi:MAG TPA: putative Ig domain-containing protein [Candidatus Acidoferrum sp.]|nr:putative Ig domain-containing protein [Candidatus Acidoferrum sp.]